MATTAALTEGGLYRLLAWLSPGFPVGAFSYSHALEAAVEQGAVRDRASLERWLATVLTHGSGRIDADLFRAAHGIVGARHAPPAGGACLAPTALAALIEISALAEAHRGTAELALESRAQGEAFLATCRAAWPHALFDDYAAALDAARRKPAYAVAVAIAAAAIGAPLAAALTAYLHAIAANLVSAAVRLVPLGQTDGQRALAALESVVAGAVEATLRRSPDDFGAASPAIDLLSMAHETQYTRLFRS